MEMSERAETPIVSTMPDPAWDSIPLLALKCILEHLEVKDAMAATATCTHWRSAMLVYEGQRDLLKLPLEDLEKSDFLVRVFKKHVRKVHVYIDVSVTEELNTFMCYILPQFLDSINLQEIVFVGPTYVNMNRLMPIAHLRRVIIETLAYKHAHVLETLAIIGCDMGVVDENDRFVNRQVEYFSKPLTFELVPPSSPASRENLILSRSNVNMMMFSNVKHIVFEYELISTDAIITLSKLDNLRVLSLNFISRKGMNLPQVDWGAVTPLFSKGLDVAVNLIHLSENRIQNVIDTALSVEMPVTSMKVMFCKHFYMSLIQHVAQTYGGTLTEFVWADPPTPVGRERRVIETEYGEMRNAPYNHVNPFIYLSWQCHRLQRLAIHGYWICEYDLLGVTRLRVGLDLDASSIYDSTSFLFEHPPDVIGGNVLRVMSTDDPPRVKPVNKNWVVSRKVYMSRLNELQTRQLTPKDWTNLPAGLKLNATLAQITEFFVSEILHPLGVT